MPDKLPALQPHRVIRALEACGFERIRQSGSHVMLWRPGLRRPVVIPQHRRELGPRAIATILRQAQISPEEFLSKI